jgi:retinol binding receptor-like protein
VVGLGKSFASYARLDQPGTSVAPHADAGYACYIGALTMDHNHNCPAMLVAVEVFLGIAVARAEQRRLEVLAAVRAQRSTGLALGSEPTPDEPKSDEGGVKDGAGKAEGWASLKGSGTDWATLSPLARGRRARTLWFLCVTLVRNPKLAICRRRESILQELVL